MLALDRSIEMHTEYDLSIPKIVCQRGMCTDAGEACRKVYERWHDVTRGIAESSVLPQFPRG